MKILNIFICCVLYILLLTNLAFGQPLNTKVDNFASPAPNAASLGMYSDVPVNLFSGTPSTQIPLFNLQEGELSVPISLSYHASGIQVRQQASWVGLGWTLNAGGSITRSVRGFADEDADGFFSNNQISPDIPNSNQVYNGSIDGESDIYSFNFNGYSGKFVYNNNGQVVLLQAQDLVINPRPENGFEGFEIITSDGTRYIFGGDNAEEKTKNFSFGEIPAANSSYEFTSSWHLKEILSFDGRDNIVFTYVNENYGVWDLALCEKNYWYCSDGENGTGPVICRGDYNADLGQWLNKTNISGKRLYKIESSRERITFITNPADEPREDIDPRHLIGSSAPPRALRRIQKKTINGAAYYCQYFDLYTSYFQNPDTQDRPTGKRLKLDSIQQRSCANNKSAIVIPPYTFEYYGQTNPDGSAYIFDRFENDVDHWGYYNAAGAVDNTNADFLDIPFSTLTCDGKVNQEGGGDKNANPDVDVQNIGTLKKITYPTSGSTNFVYETHSYLDLWISDTKHDLIKDLVTCLDMDSDSEYPVNYCCDNNNEVSANLILTQEQIDNAEFSLALFPTPEECSAGISRIEVFQNNTMKGTFTVNIDTESTGDIITEDLSFLLSMSLAPDVNTTFKVYSSYGNANFNLWWEENQVETEKYAGGLRIKSISNAPDDGGTAIVRTFDYLKNNNPSGVLFFKSDYGYCYSSEPDPFYPYVYHNFVRPVLLPLNSHEGRYIGYEEVIENTAAYSVKHTFDVPFEEHNEEITLGSYPGFFSSPFIDAPRFLPAGIGQLKHKDLGEVGSESYSYLKESEPIPDSYNSAKINGFLGCTGTNIPEHYTYTLRKSLSVMESSTIIRDGVSSETNYTYDLENHLQATEISTENSDGSVHLTGIIYPHDVNTAMFARMVEQNRITPLLTKRWVDGEMVSGEGTRYRFINSEGNVQISPTDYGPYPYQYTNYEYTWDQNGNGSGSWKSRATINKYDFNSRQAAEFTQLGWKKIYLTWNPVTHLLESKTFEDYHWDYNYFNDTRLLESVVDIDGQVTTYKYDKLMRLQRISAKNGNVKTYYSYNYKDGTSDQNYVGTVTNITETTGSDLTQLKEFQYLDGLGRFSQSVQYRYSPNNRDVVNAVEYDANGRVVKKYLPYHSPFNDGRFVTVPSSLKSTDIVYEDSPLERVVSTTPPSWYATTNTFGTNSANEVLNPTTGQAYPAGSLFKTEVTDPNGNRSISFLDRLGRDIMNRRSNSSGTSFADTYNEYDARNRLIRVIPPGGDLAGSDLDYTYLYDGANNVIEKKVPDQELATKMKYNQRNLLTYVQDANLAGSAKWLHNKYDDYGKMITSGFWQGSNPNGNSTAAFSELLSSYNYYDSGTGIGKISDQSIKVLGASTLLNTSFTYDGFGRLSTSTGNNSINDSNDAELMTYTYDFSDNPLSLTRTHKSANDEITAITQHFNYDHSGRVTNKYHQIGDGPNVRIVNQIFSYRDFIVRKNLNRTSSGSLQKVDYQYNAQGWLMRINNLCESGSSPDLFAMELKYDSPHDEVNTPTQLNGNIASMKWQVACNNIQEYGFNYDFLDRLTTAKYVERNSNSNAYVNHNRYNVSDILYDARGNLKQLYRKGQRKRLEQGVPVISYGYIDAMNYTITNNQLTALIEFDHEDARDFGFKTDIVGAGEYTYDANGNLKTDEHKGISDITYNHLNLPEKITYDNGNWIEWTYDSNGQKLKKTTSEGTVKHYLGGIEYLDDNIEAIYHDEGRARRKGSSYRYEYNIKDHLGNTRVTFADLNLNGSVNASEILQENHYYPFGMQMKGSWDEEQPNKYGYNGKEMNEDFGLNWMDYGARFYDASIGRWHAVDPLASAMPSWSSYNYVFNNPLRFIDPDGMAATPHDAPESIHKDVNGNIIAEIDDDDNNVYIHTDLGGNGQHIDGQRSLLRQKIEIYGTSGGGLNDRNASFHNKVGKFFKKAVANLFGEGNATESGRDEGTVGEGLTLMAGEGRKSEGALGTSEGETSTSIIETGDFPTSGSGITGSTVRKMKELGQPYNFLNRSGDIRQKVNKLIKRRQNTNSVQKKVCTVCGEILELDAPRSYHLGFDTIRVNE